MYLKLRKIQSYTWITLALLIILHGNLFIGLRQSIPTLWNFPGWIILVLGVILGWFLASRKLSFTWSIFASFFIGTNLLTVFLAKLLSPLGVLVYSWISVSRDLYINLIWHPQPAYPVDYQSLLLAWEEIRFRLVDLFTHIEHWSTGLFTQQRVVDIPAILMAWGMVLWLVSCWGGWSIRRLKNPLVTASPAGLLLGFTLNYTRGEALLLLPFLASTLLLMSVYLQARNEKRWDRMCIDYAEDLRLDLLIAAFLLTVTIVFIAYVSERIPQVTIDLIEKWTDHLRSVEAGPGQTSMTDTLGIREAPSSPSFFNRWIQGGLPRQHLIGSGPELSKEIVFTVQVQSVQDSMDTDTSYVPIPSERFYWRSITYDIYTGHGWTTSPVQELSITSGAELIDLPIGPRLILNAMIHKVKESDDLLSYTGLLRSIDHDFILAYRKIPTPEAPIPIMEQQSEKDIFGAYLESDQYTTTIAIPQVSLDQLRVSPGSYSSWLVERYLQLPSDIPTRVKVLAQNLVSQASTPYAQAVAIETYLRTFPYTLQIGAPPPDRDVVDFFLFDLKKGYCDYYASAMVVLARSVGLPSRLVVGYSPGTYDPINHRYVITEANSHAWVEIYFPGIGWVEFEPTAGLPIIERPEKLTWSQLTEPGNFPSYFNLRTWRWYAWLLSGLAIGFFFIILLNWVDFIHLHNLPPAVAIEIIYRRLYSLANTLLDRKIPGRTPLEFAEQLQASFTRSHFIRKDTPDLEKAIQSLKNLTWLYLLSLFSSQPATPMQRTQAVDQWMKLRWWIWKLRLLNPITRFFQNSPRLERQER